MLGSHSSVRLSFVSDKAAAQMLRFVHSHGIGASSLSDQTACISLGRDPARWTKTRSGAMTEFHQSGGELERLLASFFG
jgi:hypothetical protein